MSSFDSGVKGYVKGFATVEISFPIDFRGVIHACCHLCRYFSRGTDMCQLTKEIVLYPETNVGAKCPAEFNETEEE